MSPQFTKEEVNRSLLEKSVNSFYVEFLNLENNIANILGRSVYSLERPTLTWNTFIIRQKETQNPSMSQISFSPFNIILRDDQANIVMKIILEQLYRQSGQVGPLRINKSFDKSKFDIMVKVYDALNTPIEVFTIKGCFIVSFTCSQSIYTGATENRITIQVQPTTIDYEFVDDYIIASSQTGPTTGVLP